MVDALEEVIDRYMERVDLPPKFVIPGGTELSARLDVARAAVRRAERRVVDLKQAGDLPDETVLRYLNRASDAVYAMARYADTDRTRALRRENMRAIARRTDGTLKHEIEFGSDEHRVVADEAEDDGGDRRGPEPAGAARRQPRLVQRDHDGDVRARARAGTSARSSSTSTTSRPSAARRRSST